jgi:hypothetical protein
MHSVFEATDEAYVRILGFISMNRGSVRRESAQTQDPFRCGVGFLGHKWSVIGRKTRPDASEWVSSGLNGWKLDRMRLVMARW